MIRLTINCQILLGHADQHNTVNMYLKAVSRASHEIRWKCSSHRLTTTIDYCRNNEECGPGNLCCGTGQEGSFCYKDASPDDLACTG